MDAVHILGRNLFCLGILREKNTGRQMLGNRVSSSSSKENHALAWNVKEVLHCTHCTIKRNIHGL
jgi:hypothetical protein